MTVLVTGSRGWADEASVRAALERAWAAGHRELVHGAARRGADAIADRVGRHLGFDVRPEPADWTVKPDTPAWAVRTRPDGAKYNVLAGVDRNCRMFDDYDVGLVLAFHLRDSPGTLHCIGEARRRGVEAKVLRA